MNNKATRTIARARSKNLTREQYDQVCTDKIIECVMMINMMLDSYKPDDLDAIKAHVSGIVRLVDPSIVSE